MLTTATSLLELFRADDQGATAHQQGLIEKTHEGLTAKISGIPDISVAAVEEELGDAFDEILDVGIADILSGAWVKLKELQEYRDKERHPPGEISMVPLHRHALLSRHHPTISLYSGDTKIAEFKFDIEAKFEVRAAMLKIRDSLIIEIISGEYQMSGLISLAGEVLVKKATQPYKIPGHFSLGSGIEIPAL